MEKILNDYLNILTFCKYSWSRSKMLGSQERRCFPPERCKWGLCTSSQSWWNNSSVYWQSLETFSKASPRELKVAELSVKLAVCILPINILPDGRQPRVVMEDAARFQVLIELVRNYNGGKSVNLTLKSLLKLAVIESSLLLLLLKSSLSKNSSLFLKKCGIKSE